MKFSSNAKFIFFFIVGTLLISAFIPIDIVLGSLEDISTPPNLTQSENIVDPLNLENATDNDTYSRFIKVDGQIGGSFEAVAVSDNLAYIGEGSSLLIMDVTDPSNPAFLGKSDYMTEIIRGIAVDGDYVYIAAGESGLIILDVSDPTNPQRLTDYHTQSQNALDIVVSGNYAYLAVETDGLRVFDVSNPQFPVLTGSYYIPAVPALGLDIQGQYVYVGFAWEGLRIIDVTDPANPIMVGQNTSYYVWDVAISGEYAYTTGDDFNVFNISDPTSPHQIAQYHLNSNDPARQLVVSGSYAYVANLELGLFIIDINDPSNPYKAASFDTPGNSLDVAVTDTVIFLPDATEGFRILDASALSQPIEVEGSEMLGVTSETALNGSSNYIRYEDNDLILSAQLDRLQKLKITNPLSLCSAGFYPAENKSYNVGTADCNAHFDVHDFNKVISENSTDIVEIYSYLPPITSTDVVVSGDYAYIADGQNGLQIVDITNSFNPVSVGHLEIPGDSRGIEFSNPIIYLSASTGLYTIDVSDPSLPYVIDNYDDYSTRNAYISNIYAFVTAGDGLLILDITNPSSLYEVGYYDTVGTTFDVALSGKYAYVSIYAGEPKLEIIDVSDPYNPFKAGYYLGSLSSPTGMAVDGMTLYVADSSHGAYIFDITDPTSPIEVAFYRTVVGATHIAIADNLAYLTPGQLLLILDVSDQTNPIEAGYLETPRESSGINIQGDKFYLADIGAGLIIAHYTPPIKNYLPLVTTK